MSDIVWKAKKDYRIAERCSNTLRKHIAKVSMTHSVPAFNRNTWWLHATLSGTWDGRSATQSVPVNRIGGIGDSQIAATSWCWRNHNRPSGPRAGHVHNWREYPNNSVSGNRFLSIPLLRLLCRASKHPPWQWQCPCWCWPCTQPYKLAFTPKSQHWTAPRRMSLTPTPSICRTPKWCWRRRYACSRQYRTWVVLSTATSGWASVHCPRALSPSFPFITYIAGQRCGATTTTNLCRSASRPNAATNSIRSSSCRSVMVHAIASAPSTRWCRWRFSSAIWWHNSSSTPTCCSMSWICDEKRCFIWIVIMLWRHDGDDDDVKTIEGIKKRRGSFRGHRTGKCSGAYHFIGLQDWGHELGRKYASTLKAKMKLLFSF